MSPVSHKSLEKFSEVLQRLYTPASLENFSQSVLGALDVIFPDALYAYEQYDHRTAEINSLFNRPITSEHPDWMGHWAQVAHTHPCVNYIETDGQRKVMQIADFYSQRKYLETALYRELFRFAKIKYQIEILVPLPGKLIASTISHDAPFTDEEFTMAELIQPHYFQAYQHAVIRSSVVGHPLCNDFSAWRRLGITRRECETLQWMIEGKRNLEIAIILGISVRTVEKHVGSLLAKLHCETRTAAVIRAQEILQGR